MRKLIALLTPGLLVGCQPQTSDLGQFIEGVKQNTPVMIEAYPEFEAQPAFEYKASGLRSPFQRPKGKTVETVQTQKANCLQPDFSRQKHALEQYGMDALTISGTFTNAGTQWVLIKANDGSLHKATLGDYVGLFFGKITSIKDGTVSITEMLPDGAGCWQKKQATLSMSSKAGENDNV